VLNDLNCRVYKELAAHDIEIPYSKHDVYIKQLPPLQPSALEPAARGPAARLQQAR
jgi:small-conductance mechanosensitive channel